MNRHPVWVNRGDPGFLMTGSAEAPWALMTLEGAAPCLSLRVYVTTRNNG